MAAGNFEACMPFIFREEGGFTKDPHDAGNWTGGKVGSGQLKGTNFGISAKAYPRLDIARLTKAEAARLYRADYWNACRCDIVPAGVDLVVMDIAVNSGAARGRSFRDATIEIRDAVARIEALSDRRRAFYKGLKTFSRYGKVWLGRVARIQAGATAMALAAAGKPPAAVKAELARKADEASAAAAKNTKRATVAGAGSGTAAAATAAPPASPPPVDPSAVPVEHAASPALFLALLAVVAGALVIAVLVHRARAKRELATAYAAAAAATR